MSKLRIGAVTMLSVRGCNRSNLRRIVWFAERAAAAGCRLVVYPEFSVCGPWVSYDPGARPDRLMRQAESIPGPTTDFLSLHAGRLDLIFCVGIAEKGLARLPFNTHVVVGPQGVMHRQRKLQPTLSEVAFFRGGGDVVSTFTVDGTTLGITICADNSQPPIHECLLAQGASVILAPACGAIKKHQQPGSSWPDVLAWYRRRAQARFPAIARRTHATFVSVEAKDPRHEFDDMPDRPHYVAGMCLIYRPDGSLQARSPGNEETLVVVDV